MDGFRSYLSDKGHVQQIPVVQKRGGFGDTALLRISRDALNHQRVWGDPDRHRPRERRLADRAAQPFNGATDRRMFRRIERPVSGGGEERARQLLQAPREFRGQLGNLGHLAEYRLNTVQSSVASRGF